jgi:hypothetical protein
MGGATGIEPPTARFWTQEFWSGGDGIEGFSLARAGYAPHHTNPPPNFVPPMALNVNDFDVEPTVTSFEHQI